MSIETTASSNPPPFDRKRHIGYFAHCLRKLPEPYLKLDTNRLTLVHFSVHALDLLGVWDSSEVLETMKLDPLAIIEWVYSLQYLPGSTGLEAHDRAGFLGGTFLGRNAAYQYGHVAMTYTALCTLRTLGDDLSRVDKAGILETMRTLQRPDGSYQCVSFGSEHDMRFLYCACSISHMLSDWSAVDKQAAVSYIQACRSFDGSFALIPGQEGHGGSTFCAVASLVLLQRTDILDGNGWRQELIRWCVHRQVGGMQGRPNKAEDTCYSFWIGGTLRLLGHDVLLDHQALHAYVMTCQSPVGGFSKVVGTHPDLLHSFYSLAYLSLSQSHVDSDERYSREIVLKDLNCTLGICQDRAALFQPLLP